MKNTGEKLKTSESSKRVLNDWMKMNFWGTKEGKYREKVKNYAQGGMDAPVVMDHIIQSKLAFSDDIFNQVSLLLTFM